MSLQIIPRQGDMPISAARDLRYCYPQVLRVVVQNFNERKWPELMALTEEHGIDFGQLCDAMSSYETFLVDSCKYPEDDMHQCLVRAGWFEHRPAAQIAIMAMLGITMTGQLFYSVRETTEAGKDIDPELRKMIEACQEAIDAARRRPWGHRWRHWLEDAREAGDGLRRRFNRWRKR